MTTPPLGDQLPEIVIEPPGPRSRQLAAELQKYESPNVTFIGADAPIFWREAAGSNVVDVDGNTYIDLTAGFGVAATGHRNSGVTETIRQQLYRLQHGLGDIHPAHVKVKLLRTLSRIAPGDLSLGILASSGAEAVEAALKTARLASGKPGVLCFGGAYHGLTYGALSVTDRDLFRSLFLDQLGIPTMRAPFPHPYRPPAELAGAGDIAGAAIEWIETQLASRRGRAIGAVIVEPILGRGGVVVPPSGFLQGLRRVCDERELILIFDEIFTGMGRTGRWFACEHEGAIPDILCVGKALSDALPFSACIGSPRAMNAWPASDGEAIHTSTFLGHPLGCSAALAQIEQIRSRALLDRAARLGDAALQELRAWRGRMGVGDVRGVGALIGLELVDAHDNPDGARASAIVAESLRHGIIVTAGGPERNVLTLTPAYTIADPQLEHALSVIQDCLAAR